MAGCSLQVFISVEAADEVSVQQCTIVLNSTGFPLIVNGWLILRCTTTVREESNTAGQRVKHGLPPTVVSMMN